MCPVCWTAMIIEGLMFFAGAAGFVRVYNWLKTKKKSYTCKNK